MKIDYEIFEQKHNPHYKKNLDLAKRKEKISFFNFDHKTIHIETPIIDKKYGVNNIFNISSLNYKAIAVHISDGSNTKIREAKKEKIMKIDFHFNEIIDSQSATPLNINKKDNIYIVIFNDNSVIDSTKINIAVAEILRGVIISNIKFKEKAIIRQDGKKSLDFVIPEEGGGGVIIKKP
jgi:hypothetical protein